MNMLNIYESQYAYMYEHAAYALCSGEVPVTLYSVSIQAERNAVDECSSGFTPMLRSGSSPSSTRQQTGPIACTKLPEDI